MNKSQFMDKQIMDLSNSQSKTDFIDLMNPQEDLIGGGGGKKEEILASYDFQPIRPKSQPSSNLDSGGYGAARVWNSADSKTDATGVGVRNYASLDSTEPGKVILEKDCNAFDSALVSEVDQVMKKHADNLFHALEGVSARLTQLESRTRNLENSVDDLKVSVGNNHGSTDGKMRQLENILREVQAGVQVVKDKQEIVESQLQLAKLQMPRAEHHSGAQNTGHIDSFQPAASAPQQSYQTYPPVPITQPPSGPPPPNAPPPHAPPPPPSQQNLPPPVHLQNQFPQNQIPSIPQHESYYPPPGQTQESTNQQFQLPPAQQQQQQLPTPPPQPPQQQYPPHSQYSQPPPPPQQLSSHSSDNPPQPQPQPQPSLGYHPDEMPYVPSQNYPPSLRQPPSHQTSGAPPTPQYYGSPSSMYEPPSSRPGPGLSSTYGSGEPYPPPYGGSSSQYGSGSTMKSQQLPSAVIPSGGSGYPQLPTARILPQALPTASAVGSGSASSGSGNRVPIDDVVDRVTNMGFPRDQVRATVQKLTENGQSVDLNVVLDKLMNDGEGPQRGYYGR